MATIALNRGYIADIPDLKYCSALGETEEEALQFIRLLPNREGQSSLNH